VPPDMANRGLTGDVVAAKLLDRLSALQAQTVSNRAASSYANNWGNDIKVQIPDTGISIGEFNRYLRQWLGHETRITGEVYRTAGGIALTARAGSDTSPTFTGSEADLDALMQKAAEAVYRATQPYRYAVYLMNRNRTQEAQAVYEALIANGSPQDRAWAYIGIQNIYGNRGDIARARDTLRRALVLRPDFIIAYINIAGIEGQLQHDEAQLAAQKKATALLQQHHDPDISDRAAASDLPMAESSLAGDLGDFSGQVEYDHQVEALPDFSGQIDNARQNDAVAYAFLHDAAAVRQTFADLPPSTDPQVGLNRAATGALCDLLLGRWSTVLAERTTFDSALAKLGPAGISSARRQLWPFAAYALALSGDIAGAHGLIDKTPADCIICLRMRGKIDTLQKNWAGADYWFARAVHDAPSVPFADTDWGAMLLRKGDLDGAIAKFTQANAKGPHFADPLEMWGEALMLQNRSDLALAKFAEADTYAPNWGRLHLKWGEALLWSGDKAGAKAQFALAARLDLSASDKSELAKANAG
jgi:tetratricopeptide (TPR) repeat protein